MRCPKCDAATEKVAHGGIEVERCVTCRGLWFDLLEHEDLAKLAGSEAVDPGSSKLGKNLDSIERYDCPKCKAPMLRMVDRQQPHIWYEACGQCHGVFFDAGEFKDFKEQSLLERWKSFGKGPRK